MLHYQVLFTADIKKARIIKKASKTTGIKITKIGKIISGKGKSLIFDEKGKQIQAKSKGYIHQFWKLIVVFFIFFCIVRA